MAAVPRRPYRWKNDAMADDRERLRQTFTTDAERYDRARPRYPEIIFDELRELAHLPEHARVLEIGPGTGQATLPMAERGYEIVAVELGTELAHRARVNLASFDDVSVVTANFETWPIPSDRFDLVMSATALHWIDPALRYTKAVAALRPGGALAVFSGHHVAGGTDDFFHDVQDCYEQFMPGTPPGLRLEDPSSVVDPYADEMEKTGLFATVQTRRHTWRVDYNTESYLDLINTFSGHIALQPTNRAALIHCVRGLLDGRYSGQVTRAQVSVVTVGVTPAAQ
jgi:SAM-dependent methyltransferase